MKSRIFNFKNSKQFEDFSKKIKSIADKDSTFGIKIIEDVNDVAKSEIIIECADKSLLHKKSLWFIYKLDDEKSTVYEIVKSS